MLMLFHQLLKPHLQTISEIHKKIYIVYKGVPSQELRSEEGVGNI